MALFLPAAALASAALPILFKGADALAKSAEACVGGAARPSEAVEFYLYFFMMADLIVFERRSRSKTRVRAKAEKT